MRVGLPCFSERTPLLAGLHRCGFETFVAQCACAFHARALRCRMQHVRAVAFGIRDKCVRVQDKQCLTDALRLFLATRPRCECMRAQMP